MTIDRPRGILSKADRRYLSNPSDYSDQAAYERRQAIIERVHEALHDFPLLVSSLEEQSRAKAFEEEKTYQRVSALQSAFAFLYLGITDTAEPSDMARDSLKRMIADGVRIAYNRRGYSVRSVDVDVEVNLGPPLDELKKDENLTFAEAWQLHEAGELSGKSATRIFDEAVEGKREVGDFSAFPRLSPPKPGEIYTETVEKEDEDSES